MPGLIDIMRAWGSDTAHRPGQYTEKNRARGQHCPTALLVQDLCGGVILTCKVGRERHYYNLTAEGREVDITWSQYEYGKEKAYWSIHEVDRRQLLAREHVRRRYEILRKRAGFEEE